MMLMNKELFKYLIYINLFYIFMYLLLFIYLLNINDKLIYLMLIYLNILMTTLHP